MFGEKCLLLGNGHELCSTNGQNDNVLPFNLLKYNSSLKVQKPLLFFFEKMKQFTNQQGKKSIDYYLLVQLRNISVKRTMFWEFITQLIWPKNAIMYWRLIFFLILFVVYGTK